MESSNFNSDWLQIMSNSNLHFHITFLIACMPPGRILSTCIRPCIKSLEITLRLTKCAKFLNCLLFSCWNEAFKYNCCVIQPVLKATDIPEGCRNFSWSVSYQLSNNDDQCSGHILLVSLLLLYLNDYDRCLDLLIDSCKQLWSSQMKLQCQSLKDWWNVMLSVNHSED